MSPAALIVLFLLDFVGANVCLLILTSKAASEETLILSERHYTHTHTYIYLPVLFFFKKRNHY